MFCCAAKKKGSSPKYKDPEPQISNQARHPERPKEDRSKQEHLTHQDIRLKDQVVPVMNSGTKVNIPDELVDEHESIGISKQRYQKIMKFQAVPQ